VFYPVDFSNRIFAVTQQKLGNMAYISPSMQPLTTLTYGHDNRGRITGAASQVRTQRLSRLFLWQQQPKESHLGHHELHH
jgi:hypothetical protein